MPSCKWRIDELCVDFVSVAGRTGIAWVLDKLIFAPRRRARAIARVAAWEQEQIARGASIEPAASRRAVEESAQRQPTLAGVHGRAVSGHSGGVFFALLYCRAVQDPVGVDVADLADR